MKKFLVQIPTTGCMAVEVDAEDEATAKEAAWEKINNEGEDAGEHQWEFRERITTGNVVHAMLNQVEVEEL